MTASLTRCDNSSLTAMFFSPRELDKTAREIGVACGERRLDILARSEPGYSAGQN